MYYAIDKDTLLARIREEVSQVADSAYNEQGQSLYDSVIVTERDLPELRRWIDDAFSQFVNREMDIAKFAPQVVYQQENPSEVAYIVPRIEFYVPDFDAAYQPAFVSELENYVVFAVTAQLLVSRYTPAVQGYADRSKLAMDTAVNIIRKRKNPVTQW